MVGATVVADHDGVSWARPTAGCNAGNVRARNQDIIVVGVYDVLLLSNAFVVVSGSSGALLLVKALLFHLRCPNADIRFR